MQRGDDAEHLAAWRGEVEGGGGWIVDLGQPCREDLLPQDRRVIGLDLEPGPPVSKTFLGASSVNSTLSDPPAGNRNARIGSVIPGPSRLAGGLHPRTVVKHHVSLSLISGRAKMWTRLLTAIMIGTPLLVRGQSS